MQLIGGEQHAKQPAWNDNAMTEQEWRAVLTITLESCTGVDLAVTTRITAAVLALDASPSVLERLQRALMTALRRAFQRAGTRSVEVTVLMRVMQPQAACPAASWGFFIVERAAGDGEHNHIEVFLYPDRS
jgi:hypothetical protein